MARKASDLFVECLEAEGVRHVFGIPGEETLDLSESLSRSSIGFVPVRHEQGGGYIADVFGHLTGRAGVCLGTLGPGATNLVTAVADAFLDRSPLVVLTGQAAVARTHKESHQYIDVLGLMRPITKWNARVSDPSSIPEVVRKAFKLAEAERPGPTHIELPEDVMAAPAEGRPLPHTPPPRTEPPDAEVERAAAILRDAGRPIALAGNGVVRGGASPALREFARTTGIPVAESFMGKGLMDPEDPLALGAVGLQAGDYRLAGFDEADVVVAIGYDLVEHAPRHWNPDGTKTIVVIDTVSAEIDEHFVPQVELVGDLVHTLGALAKSSGTHPHKVGVPELRAMVARRMERVEREPSSPMRPPRVLQAIRRALGRDDILVSDVGLHKLWIGRIYPAFEPNTVLISNGLAGMGFAVPGAIGAKLAHPDRKVVAVSGDGGFLMNCQELETAVRLGTPFVSVVWEDGTFGSIAWKQRKRFGESFGTTFGNPDFVKLAEAFGLPAWRCGTIEEFVARLDEALGLALPSVLVVPIDYTLDLDVFEELGEEIVAT
ncbi:MAG: acetolactate synthase large subunit [Actinomycetota bacterium]